MIYTSPRTAPLTWLDVERRFKQETTNFTHFTDGISNIQCFSDGVEIDHNNADVANIQTWLRKIFGRALADDASSVNLDIGKQAYPISYILAPGQTAHPSRGYPLWCDRAYAGAADPITEFPAVWDGGPGIVAFHSFKGGVGRTTSLMTYAAAQLQVANENTVRILLVDADLEAPGISFWLADENRPTVSFINLLEALHYPPVDVDTSLNYFAAELRKTSLNVGSASREIFILPAALDMAEIMDMPVKPEHIARNPSNPWILTDHLRELGKKLDADMIFVDLRAGLSELASPLLFDPRIEHFFVTTVAPQSVTGMAEVLTQLYRYQSRLSDPQKSIATPSVIISLLTKQLRQLPVFAQATEQLSSAYPAANDDVLSPGFELLEAEFSESLMSIGSVKEALTLLPQSSLFKTAQLWAETHIATPSAQQADSTTTPSDVQSEATKLYETCLRFQFAENATDENMLVTDPLRNLAKHTIDELPNVVSVGAKGAGKTFTYIQLCKTMRWSNFLTKLGQTSHSTSLGTIYPLLVSTNVAGESKKFVDQARAACETEMGFTAPTGSKGIRNKIAEALLDPSTHWPLRWEELILDEFAGIGSNKATSGMPKCASLDDINNWLIVCQQSIVLVIDGIEDLFDDPDGNENQKNAIKALLELPNQLNELRNRQIGLVCFVRVDYVQAVIRQNLAQYLSRFQAFKLEWTAESFLRLAYWLCGKADVINAQPERAETITTDQLIIELEHLWGKKLGGDGSKEANSARWVFAALSDLNGRLQARDLVRFLKFAAQQMMKTNTTSWPDRLLFPEAIRKSLPECSTEKINEAVSEIKVLKQWQTILRAVTTDDRKVPFSADAVKLTPDLLAALKELGVIYEDIDRQQEENRFYLPEIYRSGLGFQYAGGRPRVQALLKRNLGGLPF
jgi:MinD-like ATPase involved in chromosome partitioning or flagellar assembly